MLDAGSTEQQRPKDEARRSGDDAAQRADVAIVGGGLVGAALGLALSKQGISSAICDATPLSRSLAADFDGRGYAVALSSRRFLRHLDVWNVIEPEAQEIRDILVSDGRPGEKASSLFLHFDHAECGPDGFGHLVEDHAIRRALLQAAAQDPNIVYLDGVTVLGVERSEFGVDVALSTGGSVKASFAAACDGRESRLRVEAGVGRLSTTYDQVGLVCAVAHERPHHGVAHEFFLPSGPFAILPLKGDRSTLVWTERANMGAALAAVDDAVYVSELRRRFGDFLGEIRLEGRRWVYPLSLSLAHRFVTDRLALVGDAARGIHPIAGQGLNFGFRDVAALAEVVGDAARRGEDIGEASVLARYERWRRPDSVAIALVTDGLNRLFSNDIEPVRWARRLGLAAFGRTGPLRRAAMRFAAGDRADLPVAMRG